MGSARQLPDRYQMWFRWRFEREDIYNGDATESGINRVSAGRERADRNAVARV
jgi:hypothetical protein